MTTPSHVMLAINPGSTSTKVAVYENERQLWSENLGHSAETLKQYARSLMDQLPMRREALLTCLTAKGFDVRTLRAVVGRGGRIPPCAAGATQVSQAMVDYLAARPPLDDHASNLGAILAWSVAEPLGIPAYIYDGVSVDQMDDLARLTGLPDFHRVSGTHVLNMRAVARKAAATRDRELETLNAVVCHMGGGISMAAFSNGRMVDLVGDEEGPYSPERSGGLPVRQLTAYLFKGACTQTEMARRLRGQGGLVAYLGTSDAREVERRIEGGDARARQVYEGMAYQIAKSIGTLAVALRGRIDVILLTGSLAHSALLTEMIKRFVAFLAPVDIYPGENEMEALALGALRVLRGQETAAPFNPVKKVTLHYDG